MECVIRINNFLATKFDVSISNLTTNLKLFKINNSM